MARTTPWRPGRLAGDRPAYVALADALARDLARGDLLPGDRLPTHRALAAELGVTVRTVARGYAEAERRGLVSGEVGRGTYVSAGFGLAPSRARLVDLAVLHPPIAPGAPPTELFAATLRSIAGDPLALRTVTETEHGGDHPTHRAAAATWVAHGGFTPRAEQMLLSAGAQHAIAVCLLALVPPGSVLATTILTNPGVIAAARALSVPLVAVEADADGMVPEALAEACSRAAISAVHLQPTFDNPHGRTMPLDRRQALVEVAERHDLWLIEDDPLAALAPHRPDPLAALAPDRTCYVTSAAKVMALGLRVGMLAAPDGAYSRLSAALRGSTWLTAPLLGEVLARWIRDGVADHIRQRRVTACAERDGTARGALKTDAAEGDHGSPHRWLELPAPWSAGAFMAAARDAGILVAPGDDFTADRSVATHAIRLGLNAEVSDDQLRDALATLARLVSLGPGVQ